MEISEINMISDFEAGMKCLQNPSIISRFDKVCSFWKWGALFFAIFATFSSIIRRRIKLILIRFHKVKPSPHQIEEAIEDDRISLASSDDDDDDDDEREKTGNRQTTSFGGQRRVDQDSSVKGVSRGQWSDGNLRLRKRLGGAWSEFATGKSVVKLWDSLGFNLDFDEDLFGCDEQNVVSTWEGRGINFPGGDWGLQAEAPATAAAVVLTAERNRKGDGVIWGGYDARMPRCVPALYAEWGSPTAEKVASVATGGVGKVFVRDDVGGVVAVGDVRNVKRPLESVGECDGDTWWDADAVIVEAE